MAQSTRMSVLTLILVVTSCLIYFTTAYLHHVPPINSEHDKIEHEIHGSWEPFNNTNPHIHSWCPTATCHNSPICAPCDRRYLFIFATARSGSTSLLQMLNELPGVRLSGENDNALFRASKLFTERNQKILRQDFDRTSGAWSHNAISPNDISCPIQQYLQTFNPPPLSVQQHANRVSLDEYDASTIMGAKMIRVQKGKWKPESIADFIKTHFPCSRVIINIRSDVKAQLKSIDHTFVNNDHVTEEAKLQEQTDKLVEVAKELGEDMAKLVDMTEWATDKHIIEEMIRWLGFEGCSMKSTLHNNQGSDGFEQDKTKQRIFGKKCRYPHSS